MSYRSLLVHRADVQRFDSVLVDGSEQYLPKRVAVRLPCRIDLQYIRMGKDPQWTPEAGRPEDRTGVAMFLPGADVRTGDRLQMVRGPAGTFLVDGSVDEILGGRGRVHHLEVAVKEVPGPLARAHP